VIRLLRRIIPFSLTLAAFGGCAHPQTSAPVLGAHSNPGSESYVGMPQVATDQSRQQLFARYPRKEPDNKLRDRLAEILTDGGRTLHWSATATQEHFKNGDLEVPVWVRTPPRCEHKSCPVVVEVYGGGGCFNGSYHWRSEFFLRAGFIVVQPNIRGSSCFGKEWETASQGRKKLEALTDIEACGKWVHKRFSRGNDSPRVGIVGWSYGALVALTGMTRFSGTFDAGYAFAAKTDLYSFFKSAPDNLRKARETEYGSLEKDPELFHMLSPITYANQAKGPIAIMLGGRDPKVSLSDADAFIRTLRARGQDASMMIVPEHGHLTERPDEITFEHAHIIQFFSDKFSYPIDMQ